MSDNRRKHICRILFCDDEQKNRTIFGTPARRCRRDPRKRVDAALAAAEKLLVEMGPEKTSIPEIANLANVPRTTIYQYFPDKYALFAHLAESIGAEFRYT